MDNKGFDPISIFVVCDEGRLEFLLFFRVFFSINMERIKSTISRRLFSNP